MNLISITGKVEECPKVVKVDNQREFITFILREEKKSSSRKFSTITHRIEAFNLSLSNIKKGMEITIFGRIDKCEIETSGGKIKMETVIRLKSIDMPSNLYSYFTCDDIPF